MAKKRGGRTEHLATRVTVEERELAEKGALKRVQRVPQLLTLSDYIRALIVEGAARDCAEEPPADATPAGRRRLR